MRGNFRQLSNKNVQIGDHFLPLLFPKDIGHPTSGSGGIKTVKRYLKNEHTDGQTDGQTDGHFDLLKASAQRADASKSNK